ncbi:MAG: DNA helicase RecQ [Eubacteriaceae bacterium]|nr:DNA helicase RecQ [Eubacteriaceae bacterium]
MDKYSLLKKYFGHSEFKPGQEYLIDAILEGRDAMGIMPTGGGKSLCYQIPSLMLSGLSLIVSPLIALMKDQVAALKEAGAQTAFINSSLSYDEIRIVYDEIFMKKVKIVYIAPERLEDADFCLLMSRMEISLVAVDEAHCISQWGQDFRPSYLKISEFIASLPRRPVVAAFTATATERVRGDIKRLLGLQNPLIEITGFDRPNLFFDVLRPKNKEATLKALVSQRRNKSGIIYCATRNGVEKIWNTLIKMNIPATRYHAGLTNEERQTNQDDFQFDRKTVMVATNAFGMGIDKSNVGYVIHYNMPKSLEAYYQEAGRAGRDSAEADCILLYSPGDVVTAKYLIENRDEKNQLTPTQRAEIKRKDYERLEIMNRYCKTTSCLRGYILNYFSQPHEGKCSNCGNCKGEFEKLDISLYSQMILSCIVRTGKKLGYNVGRALIISTLRGSGAGRIRELGLDKLSTYGLMNKTDEQTLRGIIDHLEEEGYIRTNPAHSTLEITEKASLILFKGEKVMMSFRRDKPLEMVKAKKEGKKSEGKRKTAETPEITEEAAEIFEALKATRTKLAKNAGLPAYIIFSNATLNDMAEKMPRNIEEFLEVSGVGEVKAARYGKDFLETLAAFAEGEN